jgi:hypothetical protein
MILASLPEMTFRSGAFTTFALSLLTSLAMVPTVRAEEGGLPVHAAPAGSCSAASAAEGRVAAPILLSVEIVPEAKDAPSPQDATPAALPLAGAHGPQDGRRNDPSRRGGN